MDRDSARMDNQRRSLLGNSKLVELQEPRHQYVSFSPQYDPSSIPHVIPVHELYCQPSVKSGSSGMKGLDIQPTAIDRVYVETHTETAFYDPHRP
jgi:hypothetical protein